MSTFAINRRQLLQTVAHQRTYRGTVSNVFRRSPGGPAGQHLRTADHRTRTRHAISVMSSLLVGDTVNIGSHPLRRAWSFNSTRGPRWSSTKPLPLRWHTPITTGTHGDQPEI
ncbi:hypothetical protein [Paenarthrobacter sp. A20]|uniref:hypothetical protein n=1 Tax=Paenarthrobacter sp. A20 TaxID=2817891 RepID=UPI00209FBF45|nr:hypothetical protein [Paenarthrobacter sp. A20]MCP1415728.1 hypothetical protein [Paenarthrobacter sp. A20]